MWEAVQPRLEELLAEWEPWTTGKQRITAMRLHRQLRAEGYRVGRTLVGDYWREEGGFSFPAVFHGAEREPHVDFSYTEL